MIDAKKSTGALAIEIRKNKARSTIAVSGIISVEELCAEKIVLTSHGGRIAVSGTSLELSVFEGKAVEIAGKISGVEFQ